MKIRTITLGIKPSANWSKVKEDKIRNFFSIAGNEFAAKGAEIRTKRITLPPFCPSKDKEQTLTSIISELSDFCNNESIRWFCVPFKAVGQNVDEIETITSRILKKHKNSFINYIVTEGKKIDYRAVSSASRFIRRASRVSNNGIDNFRCGVSLNCKPHGPFFPFSYHTGRDGFSIALEIVPLCLKVVKANLNNKLEIIRKEIIKNLTPVIKQVDKTAKAIEKRTSMKYYGIDVSLAPHPEHSEHSVAYLIELLGIDIFGSNGTTFITSFLTDTLKALIHQSGIRSTGFNGVMYSLLEDPRLGVICSKQKTLSVDSLIMFSSMCGCGLDMVPLPGNVQEKEIASIILDVAAISLRLNKPLGVRLLPIPGKTSGEITEFSHDFLHNAKIQKVKHKGFSPDFLNTNKMFEYIS